MSTIQTTPETFTLKPIRKEGIPRALEKVQQYRLLNEPMEAESICRDILAIEPDNQEAIIKLVLTLSDGFGAGKSANEANELIEKIDSKYHRQYYKALILERQGKATLVKAYPRCEYDAYEWLREAILEFEKADQLSEPDNNDAILRRNTCVRIIMERQLSPRPEDTSYPILE
ncbi:MAG: hypothetical protein RLO17_15030 [Cyclobacteriaceae bacterium]